MRLVVMPKAASPIFFNVPQAQRQLEEKRCVVTLRRRRKSEGKTHARVGNLFHFRDLGEVTVELLKEGITNCEADLEPYLEESGFKSTKEWCARATAGADTLYRVCRV